MGAINKTFKKSVHNLHTSVAVMTMGLEITQDVVVTNTRDEQLIIDGKQLVKLNELLLNMAAENQQINKESKVLTSIAQDRAEYDSEK